MKKEEMIKVSVIVPCYNYGRFLSKCLNSVLEQSFQDFEIIVINDCSKDNTKEVLKKYEDNPKIRVIHHTKNLGFPKSVNEGVKLSKGEYIAMICADDYLINTDACLMLSQVLDKHPFIAMVHSAHYYVDTNTNHKFLHRPSSRNYIASSKIEFKKLLMRSYYIADLGVLIRKRCYEEVGGRDENIINCCDRDLWLRLAHSYAVGYLKAPLGAIRLHGSSMHNEFVSSGKSYKETLYILDKVFNDFTLGREEKKLKNRAYALCELERAFQVYNQSVVLFREHLRKAVKFQPFLRLNPKVLVTYLKSLLGNSILEKLRALIR